MKPIKFPEANVTFGENQPQFEPLPAYLSPNGIVVSCWVLTPEVAQLLAQVRWLAPIKFGCDSPKQIGTCEKAMSLIDSYAKTPRSYLLFTIIMGDIQECYERISYFKSFSRVRVHAQPMREFDNPRQIIPQWQKDMARWSDRKELYRSIDFKEFQPRKGFICNEYFKDLEK